MSNFGVFIKEARVSKELTLREFCKLANLDPSNWSKTERGINPPPKSREVLDEIASVLSFEISSEDYNRMIDLATVGSIPKELLTDEKILEQLPVFFRTLRGDTPTDEELDDLIKLFKR